MTNIIQFPVREPLPDEVPFEERKANILGHIGWLLDNVFEDIDDSVTLRQALHEFASAIEDEARVT